MTTSRNAKILRHVNTSGRGLEIGPGAQPIVSKAEGYRVEIIDYLSRGELVRKFENEPIDPAAIEEVDYIWHGESLPELTGCYHQYDFIIASHVIEHTTDFISFLNDAENLLTDNGVLSLVIPDKRYCFDHYRPLTGLAGIIDAHVNHRKRHSLGTAAEHFLYYVSNNSQAGWTDDTRHHFQLRHTVTEAKHLMEEIKSTGRYLDLHAWCFTPSSFLLIIQCLAELDLINMHVIDICPTEGFEFYVTLKSGKPIHITDRLLLLERVQDELLARMSVWKRLWMRLWVRWGKIQSE
ncbi:methyltransferase domain-containing protein [bacterium]|nr:methyltransferase domain-containing protein [candidate division CSSED10-310 bacterium]